MSYTPLFILQPNLSSINLSDLTSIVIGLAIFGQVLGCLRFLSYLDKYNMLLITLRLAMPSVLRFMVCAGVLYTAFVLTGWLVLGPYHSKVFTVQYMYVVLVWLAVTKTCMCTCIHVSNIVHSCILCTCNNVVSPMHVLFVFKMSCTCCVYTLYMYDLMEIEYTAEQNDKYMTCTVYTVPRLGMQ